MRVKYVIMYKLKNLKNIEDIVQICKANNIKPIYIQREDIEIPNIEDILYYRDIEEAYKSIDDGNIKYVVLETYGDKYVNEIDLSSSDIAIIVGAEDIGIPKDELVKIDSSRVQVVRIPMNIQGTSYNVVTSLVMLITEVMFQEMMKVS